MELRRPLTNYVNHQVTTNWDITCDIDDIGGVGQEPKSLQNCLDNI